MNSIEKDVVIVGGGAAGLMCAIEAGKRGRSVLVLEHNGTIGEKIRISGGGRCNFTNLSVQPQNYISQNPHFCKSALARYPSSSFIRLVEKHGIAYHEKKLGQLFCDGSSREIVDMLLGECRTTGAEIRTNAEVNSIRNGRGFEIETSMDTIRSTSLVVATGGLSVQKLGATDFGYSVARQFGLKIVPPRPGLVPLTFEGRELALFSSLSGVSVSAEVSLRNVSFRDDVLFTHRGLSGPAILQLSSYWTEGEVITVDLLPGLNASEFLLKHHGSRLFLGTVLEKQLPRRFCQHWLPANAESKRMQQYSQKQLREAALALSAWKLRPTGTEGFAKAEVTVGGVGTNGLSSKTMEAKSVPGLYFVGEVVDVTGWLGGYNFQWAWSSGWVAGQYV